MKKIKRKIMTMFFVLALTMASACSSFAYTAADAELPVCSVDLIFEYDDVGIEGIEIALVEIASYEGNYTYEPLEEYAELMSGYDLSTLSTSQMLTLSGVLVGEISAYDMTATTDSDGIASFENISEYGLYLVIQVNTVSGYTSISPYIIDVPHYEDGEWVYEIEAESKVAVTKQISDSNVPQMGDSSSPLLYVASLIFSVLAIAACAIILVILGKRAKRESEKEDEMEKENEE